MDVEKSMLNSFYDAVNSLMELQNQPNLKHSESVRKPHRLTLEIEIGILQNSAINSKMARIICLKNHGCSVYSFVCSILCQFARRGRRFSTGTHLVLARFISTGFM
jgi:hypothetical protein